MPGKKRRRAGSPRAGQRQLFRRAAAELGVSAGDYERADVLAQIAELIIGHRSLGKLLAFKGGAIMTLVDGSPRLSADLDAVVVSGRAVLDRDVREALLDMLDGRRIVTQIGLMNPGRQSLQFPFLKALSFSGLAPVNIRLEISWREALLLPAETVIVRVPRHIAIGSVRSRAISLPVLARPERVAEKVRAFMERGLDRDAFDLFHHAQRLSQPELQRVRRLIQRKLELGELPEGCDLHRRFAEALHSARDTWPRGLVIVGAPPPWPSVERALAATYKPLLRSPLRRR